MFSIHGVTGRLFHGPLEQLVQVPGVIRTQRVRGIAHDGEENFEAAARVYGQTRHRETQRGPLYHAYQIMSRVVTQVRAESRIDDAWRILVAGRIRQAPVLDRTDRLVGIVSERDLLTVLNVEDGALCDVLERTVAEVMSSPVVSADPVADIRRVARVLLDTGLTGVPVVNETGVMVGFISRGDILRAVIADPPLSLWA